MNKTVRKLPQFTQRLHYLMILLCLAASVTLFLTHSLLYKLVLGLLLLAYAAFLLKHPQLTSLLLRTQPALTRTEHAKVHQWESSTSAHRLPDTSLSSAGKGRNNEKSIGEDASMVSAQRSMREDSFSSFRGLSTSYLNDSHLSASSRHKIFETRGKDISGLLSDRSQTKSLAKSSTISEMSMQIMDRKSIARKRLQVQQAEGQRGYEQQLTEVRKSSKYVQGRYQLVLNSIHSLVNPLFNEHRTNTSKLIQISQEFLDITLDDKAASSQQNLTKMRGSALRISFQGLLQQFLTTYSKVEPLELTKLPLRAGKKWNDLQKKVNQLIRARIRLAESLGVSTEGLLSSNIRKGVTPFIEQYSNYIGLLETFVGADLTKKAYQAQLDELSEECMLREFKSRIYVLYLYVRYLNSLLKGTPKVCLKDYLGFKATATEADFQISPKYTFDAYVPYYNLWVKEGEGKKCYPCEYGPANYLSLIYFLMLMLSRRSEVKERPDVARIINEII